MNYQHFVGAEVGFWSHPRLLAFCADVQQPLGGAFLLRLREYCLLYGSPDGRMEDARPEDLEVYCGWTGAPGVLIRSLQRHGYLAKERTVFFIPWWERTVTGHYQSRRLSDARRKQASRQKELEVEEAARLEAAAARAARKRTAGDPGESGPRSVRGLSADGPRSGDPNKKESKNEVPPGPPAGAGGGPDPAWDWLLENYPNPQYPERSRAIWDELTEEDHARIRVHVQKCLLKKNPRFVPGLLKMLRSRSWMATKLPKPTAQVVAPEGPTVEDRAAAAREQAIMARRIELKRKLRAKGITGPALEQAIERELEVSDLVMGLKPPGKERKNASQN